MCHLLLLLPMLALPVFWLWPMAIAAPVYGVVLIISLWVYFLALRAMRQSVGTGAEELLGSEGIVLSMESGLARVRVHSEIWFAQAVTKVRAGDRVKVVGIDGLRLRVQRQNEVRDTHRARATVHGISKSLS